MSEEQLLNEWFIGEKQKGLVDFKVTLNPNCKNISKEQLCKDLLAAIQAVKDGKSRRLTPADYGDE